MAQNAYKESATSIYESKREREREREQTMHNTRRSYCGRLSWFSSDDFLTCNSADIIVSRWRT